MKVLFVIVAFGRPSGAENVLVDFLSSENSIEPCFLLIGDNRASIDFFSSVGKKENLHFVFCDNKISGSLSRHLLMPIYQDKIYAKLKEDTIIKTLREDNSLDLVYFNNTSEAAYFWKLFSKYPFVVHSHDMINMFRWAHKRVILQAMERSNAILTASKAVKMQLIENGIDKDKITVAYNGVNFLKSMGMDCSVRDNYFSDKREICIGFVGSVIKRKGFDVLVAVLNRLRICSAEKKFSLLVITNTETESEYMKKCLALLSKDVNLTIKHNLPRRDVLALYNQIDILAVPSRYDPLPTVVLEGFMCGAVVVGSRQDGIPEMIIDDRLLFDIKDINATCDKVMNILSMDDRQVQEIVLREQKYITETFSSQKKNEVVMKTLNSVRL